MFDWTVSEKIYRSAIFLRQQVVPRRQAILAIAQEIEELNNTNLAAQRTEVTRQQAAFRDDLRRMLWQTVLLGVAVALVAVFRLFGSSGADPMANARSPRRQSGRCASCHSSSSRRRKRSGRTCRGSFTITSARS